LPLTARRFLGVGASGSDRPVGLGGGQPLRTEVSGRLPGQDGKPSANPVERLLEYLRSGGVAGVGSPGFSSPTGLGHSCTGLATVLAGVLVTRTTDPVVQLRDPVLVERGHRLSLGLAPEHHIGVIQLSQQPLVHDRSLPSEAKRVPLSRTASRGAVVAVTNTMSHIQTERQHVDISAILAATAEVRLG